PHRAGGGGVANTLRPLPLALGPSSAIPTQRGSACRRAMEGAALAPSFTMLNWRLKLAVDWHQAAMAKREAEGRNAQRGGLPSDGAYSAIRVFGHVQL